MRQSIILQNDIWIYSTAKNVHPNISTSNVTAYMSFFPQYQWLKGIILPKYPSKFRALFVGSLSLVIWMQSAVWPLCVLNVLHFSSQSLYFLSHFFVQAFSASHFDNYRAFWFPHLQSLFFPRRLLCCCQMNLPGAQLWVSPAPTLSWSHTARQQWLRRWTI